MMTEFWLNEVNTVFKSVTVVSVTGSGWWQTFDWTKWMRCLNLWPSCQWLVWWWNFQSAGPAARFEGGHCVQHLRHPCFICAVRRYATLRFRGTPRLVLILFIPLNLCMEEDYALRKWSSLWKASCVVPASLFCLSEFKFSVALRPQKP